MLDDNGFNIAINTMAVKIISDQITVSKIACWQ